MPENDPKFDTGRCKTCSGWAQRLNWHYVKGKDAEVLGHSPECQSIGDVLSFDEDTFVRSDGGGYGYAIRTNQGTCGPKVTAQDIAKLTYHSYFGGRGAWAKDGRWGSVTHTD